MRQKDFKLSVIVPVFNEENNIDVFLVKITPIISKYQYELMFIDDGSVDKTAQLIKKYIKLNKNIKLISFNRNFGQQTAFIAGYNFLSGDCAVSLDVDLQDPPELIHEMIKKWQHGTDIIYAKRQDRQESFFKKNSARLFYYCINLLSDTRIPVNVGDYRLIDKKVVEMLNLMPEKSKFLRGLVAWSGYKCEYIEFIRKERKLGQTHYPLSKMLTLALDGIISFSNRPLKLASIIGIATSFIGLLGIFYALFRRFFMPQEFWVTGWTALFVAIMFFGGVQLITIGIIGEYIARIYTEIQNRPQYLIKEKINI